MNITLKQTYSILQMGLRDNQEDSRYPDTNLPHPSQRFFVICDGVGGSEKGEIASQTVCRAIAKSMKSIDLEKDFSNDDFRMVLDDAYNALDRKVNKYNRDMATTMAFVCFHAGCCTMAHIGDSRIYHIRKKKGILYKSDDHSLVNSMVHNGIITPDEGVDNPQSNVITRYMSPVRADENRCMATVMRTYDIQDGDYFFICTDGVSNVLDEETLFQILTNDSMTDEQKMSAIASATEKSSDNNTAFLIPIEAVEYEELGDSQDSPEERTSKLPFKREGSKEIESIQIQKKGGFIERIKHIFN